MEPLDSLFQKWTRREYGATNFGSFQTAIFQAYQIADLPNRKRLRIAFPLWFESPQKANDPVYINNILYVTAHAQALMRYLGIVKAHIQDERVMKQEKMWGEWILENNF